MRDRARVCLSAAVLASALVSITARAGEPDEKTQCISASDQGQQLRDDGKFKLAREAFTRCSRDTCPGIVRQECAQWQVDLDAKSPTVVVDAMDDKGNDLVDVKVTVDDEELVTKLDGLPLAVDGGEHVFRYEAAGFASIEEHVVVRAGEKNRLLKVRFEGTASLPLEATAPIPARAHSGPPVMAWIFTGVAVAAFASETYFGLSGVGQYNIDKGPGPGSCAGHCSQSEINSIKTQFAIADVSLAVGVVSACFAGYFFLRPRSPNPIAAPAVDFVPRPGGGMATLGGHF